MDVTDNYRAKVIKNIGCSYNDFSKNRILHRELMLHASYLNKLVASFATMQEARVVKGEKLRLSFDTESETTSFFSRAAIVSEKLKKCFNMNICLSQQLNDNLQPSPTLDLFDHPELKESDSCIPKTDLHHDSIEDPASKHSNLSGTRSVVREDKIKDFLKKPENSETGYKATSLLYSKISKQRENQKEKDLINQIFDQLKKKAFVSDRFNSNLPEVEKLELIMKFCRSYK